MNRSEILAALRELGELHKTGILSAEEFQREKDHFLALMRGLSGAAPAAPTPPPPGADGFLTGGSRPPNEPSPLAEAGKVGEVLGGRFRLERLLGQGGMGQVWLASDLLKKGQIYALKRLLPALGRDEHFRQQFVQELTLTEKLHHPGIIRTFDLQEASGLLFYTMEYIEGQTLEQALTAARTTQQGQRPLFGVARVVGWLSALADSLHYAHQKGVIHRDLKPSNVLLAADGSLKLMDFGIAKALSHTHATQHTGWKGTLHYTAPEQMRGGEAVTAAADIYALGVVGYELLTGDLPLGRFQTPRERLPALPPAVDSTLLRALEFAPADRFPDAASFQAALTATPAVSAPPKAPAPASPKAAAPAPAPREAGEKSTSSGLLGAALVWCPPGTFRMGSDDSDEEAYNNEKPAQDVTLTRGFWMKQTPVTQGEWQALAGFNPSRFTGAGAKAPVERVSWFEAVWFCNLLSKNEGLSEAYRWKEEKGKPGQVDFELQDVELVAESPGYRLPTEAEWEYACRAGTSTPRYGALHDIAWYDKNSGSQTHSVGEKSSFTRWLWGVEETRQTHSVGEKQPNGWGLSDMLGNVWEWCFDVYADSHADLPTFDPLRTSAGSDRVERGGSWLNDATFVRSAVRLKRAPALRYDRLGFRVLRS